MQTLSQTKQTINRVGLLKKMLKAKQISTEEIAFHLHFAFFYILKLLNEYFFLRRLITVGKIRQVCFRHFHYFAALCHPTSSDDQERWFILRRHILNLKSECSVYWEILSIYYEIEILYILLPSISIKAPSNSFRPKSRNWNDNIWWYHTSLWQ